MASNNCDYIINKEISIIVISEDYIVKGNDITSEFDTLKMNIDWTKYDVEEKPVSEDKKKEYENKIGEYLGIDPSIF